MRLMVTRPAADAAPLAQRLARLGHDVILEPLLEIGFRDHVRPDLGGVAAVLATSANGVRALARMSARRDLPVLAVGDATARAAREAGFERVASAAGTVERLAALVVETRSPSDGCLLHVAGTRVAGDLQELLSARGFLVRRVVGYHAKTSEGLSAAGAEAVAAGDIDGVLFFSPRTARTFVSLALKAGLGDACRRVTVYCLSAAVAERAVERSDDLGWRRVAVAARPDEASLLELLEADP